MSNYLSDNFELGVQKEAVDVSTAQRNYLVGFLRGMISTDSEQIVVTPQLVAALVDNHVPVRVERKLGGDSFIDLNYADVGAWIEDEADAVIRRSNILVKLSPFTRDDFSQFLDNQIIISYSDIEQLTLEELQIFQQKKITAISIDKAIDANGKHLISTILNWKVDHIIKCRALDDYLQSLLLAMIMNSNLRYAVQMNPALLHTVYCYKGMITNQELSNRFSLPWKDLLLLCWDWN
ncbi:MAG TPA: hypothetical protein PKK66_00850 [Bacteroidales bacterium]|jgi:alanine dehydrogenase|nr:hypothetical protein [Bacteroidales bacterium]HNW67387.1 hypothetical protein [Bacteroidales bacterium]HPT51862.1 hypothetical protein [Bacteroidales bacterium]